MRGALESQARNLELRDSIRWEGQKRDVCPYLAACDVFVNVSWREGCCNAILEAMAAAKPVVAYAVGGNPELIRHDETGRAAASGVYVYRLAADAFTQVRTMVLLR